MGKNLRKVGILPTPYTQNFWYGCQPVSEGCAHCYARCQYEGVAERGDFSKLVLSETWNDPPKWQKSLAKARKVDKVFTCSWSDFFHPDADQWRAEAWDIIRDTPNLLWYVLTKRAQCIADRLPSDWGEGYPNVCLGVTVELKKGSIAQFMGKRAVENAAPWKSPKAGLSHCAWKSRKRSEISTFSTAPARMG